MFFDVEGAIFASELAGMARGLIISSLFLYLVSAFVLMKAKSRSLVPTEPGHVSAYLPIVALATGITGILGSIIGIFATIINQNILNGSGVFGVFVTNFGLLSLCSFTLFAIILILFKTKKFASANVSIKMVANVLASVLFISTILISVELPRPLRNVEGVINTATSVTVTALLSPGATGSNTLRVGLTGPDEEVKRILDFVKTGEAKAELISLEQDANSKPISLSINQEGSLEANGVTVGFSGRSRIQIQLYGNQKPVGIDVTLQKNPGYSS